MYATIWQFGYGASPSYNMAKLLNVPVFTLLRFLRNKVFCNVANYYKPLKYFFIRK